MTFGQQVYAAQGQAGFEILNPVPGSKPFDSFGAPRSGGRRHKGIDLMAPEGAPIVAPVAGTVVKRSHGEHVSPDDLHLGESNAVRVAVACAVRLAAP